MKKLIEGLSTAVVERYELAENAYYIPSLPKSQCIVIPLIREVIAPIIIRNNDSDSITTMVVNGKNRVRMIGSKTKGVERRRGGQILRALGVGGIAAANRAYIPKDKTPGDVFDLNTFVFGDSANGSGKFIYPVHSSVLYSDAISIQPISSRIVDATFRQGSISEDGGAYDADKGGIGTNIFTTRAVNPGTFFVQTLVFLGNRITKEALNHLILSIVNSGSYGGGTAATGTNIKTHLCGIYWGKIERAIDAPEEILKSLEKTDNVAEKSVDDIIALLASSFANEYPNCAGINEVNSYVDNLVTLFENDDEGLIKDYVMACEQSKDLFNKWFIKATEGTQKEKNNKKDKGKNKPEDASAINEVSVTE